MGDLNAQFCVWIKHISHLMPTSSPHMWPLGSHTGATMWTDMAGGGNVGFPGGGVWRDTTKINHKRHIGMPDLAHTMYLS